MLSGLIAAVLLSAAPSTAGQHCGGPCEVPRPAAPPASPNLRFKLGQGKEKTNWRYLHNFIWTVDGVEKFRLEKTLSSPQMIAFGYRRIFVSPAGNGFLVTGNAYARGRKFLLSGKTHAGTAPLFVFCDPRGTPIVEVRLQQELTKEELKTGPCPSCDCKDILFVFKKDPALSANGCFVELQAAGTGRPISFFLPLGAQIKNRAAFEDRLAALEWARIPSELQAAKRAEIKKLVTALDNTHFKTRVDAGKSLTEMGFLALPSIRAGRSLAGSAEKQLRLRPIEEQLWRRWWAADGHENVSVDLDLLTDLLTYPEEAVVKAVRARLSQILPKEGASDWGDWIKKHRDRLQWDKALGRYRETDGAP